MEMQTSVEFRSAKFPPYEGEEDRINPGVWGQRLAEYLVAKLAEKGITAGPPIAEDWGWYIPLQHESQRLAICCSHQYGDDDQFLCFTDPRTPVLRKLFRKIDVTGSLTDLVQALREILSADPDITDIQWSEG